MPRKKTIENQIIEVLESIRPYMQMDGGDVEFVSYDNQKQVVSVRLSGACHGCPFAGVTLSQNVLKKIQEKIPQITDVVNI